ncbi:unnamed protein product [Tilletia laevis]|uniref:Dynamin stalk domain-containing protein n=3 Tax=Tilletia TaxID=13289 RepID=A0A8X7SZN0_9BASI|nr:hypothetical protein CF336_g6087 [Tilletia laevis]KAE8254186.1 hypothetical protein A4X06_0g1020 [Tilletia controversa]KAE8255263.1 hypothetical protein A4X03_0g5590 [Tilletia caries]KAE8194145.1 hypothetical protein CF335_g5415 [Tilletia laevis]CAD6891318.1 unnamed protein product [Tilletia caries]
MELQRFPRLHAQLIAVVSKLLRERLDPSSGYVQSLISIQAAYINTNHPLSVKYRETDARGPESEASVVVAAAESAIGTRRPCAGQIRRFGRKRRPTAQRPTVRF